MKRKNCFVWITMLSLALFTSCSQNELDDISSSVIKESSSTKITLEQAKVELEKLIDDVDAQTTRSSGKRKIINSYTINADSSKTRSTDQTPTLYIFNFDNDNGYAIMTDDISTPSLLALTDSGNLSENEAIDNPGVAIFLENTSSKIIPSKGIETNTSIHYGNWVNTVYKQNGYCSVKWGQDYPYNIYCQTKDSVQAPTGCVATAVAQLMSVYKEPSSYNGYSFDWDNMTAYQTANGCKQQSRYQIARLMQQLGTSSNLDVTYKEKSSSAPIKNISRTLKNFGYSNGGSIIDYNTDKIREELSKGFCVLISGYSHKESSSILGIKVSTSYKKGHCWLCHGLLKRVRTVTEKDDDTGKTLSTWTETQWYVLCNWGWDGYHDGYFLSSVFDSNHSPDLPDNTTSTRSVSSEEDRYYQYKIQAITGIRK